MLCYSTLGLHLSGCNAKALWHTANGNRLDRLHISSAGTVVGLATPIALLRTKQIQPSCPKSQLSHSKCDKSNLQEIVCPTGILCLVFGTEIRLADLTLITWPPDHNHTARGSQLEVSRSKIRFSRSDAFFTCLKYFSNCSRSLASFEYQKYRKTSVVWKTGRKVPQLFSFWALKHARQLIGVTPTFCFDNFVSHFFGLCGQTFLVDTVDKHSAFKLCTQ